MKSVYFATGNKGKYISMSKELKKYEIKLIHKNIKFEEELDSKHVEEVSLDKVLRAYRLVEKPVITVDAGFFIPSLDGYPGTKVNKALKEDGIDGILERLKNKGRFCTFKQCLAYTGPEMSNPTCFTSINWGYLTEEKRGSMEGKSYLWSELGLIFIPEGETKTLAEMTREEYQKWRENRGEKSIVAKFGTWYSLREIGRHY